MKILQAVMGQRHCIDSVAPDTVLMIQVSPTVEQSVDDYIRGRKRFRTFDPSEPRGIGYLGYVDEEDGFVIQIFKGKVTELVYLPSKGDQEPCAGYYLNPLEVNRISESIETFIVTANRYACATSQA